MSLLNRPSARQLRNRQIADVLVGTSVAGFGLSLGRDAYRKLTGYWLLLLLAAAVFFGAAYAGWDMARGHDGGEKLKVALRYSFAILLFLVGFGTTYALASLIITQDHRQAGEIAFVVQIVSACVGALVGIAQRPNRLKSFEVKHHNTAFLAQAGLREVGGSYNTVLDDYGNELTLDDARDDRLILRCVRNKDAFGFIDLDEMGRMIAYHPPAV